MRFQLKRLSKFLAISFCSFYLIYFLSSGSSRANQCFYPVAYQNKLHELAVATHGTLSKLNVTHFLCYESLWASLYNQAARSWDSRFDLCVLASDLSRYEEAFLVTFFKNEHLRLEYDSAEGEYIMQHMDITHPRFQKTVLNSPTVNGRLVLFTVDGSMAKRLSGWKRRMLPTDCEISQSLDCFPSRLIEPPLPSRSFGPVALPSPREEIEIQKYHFPDDWWLQRHVPEC